MERLSTDLIGRVFNENQTRYLVTDRKARQPGHAVVREVQAGAPLVEMPLNYIKRQVHKEY